MWKYKDEIEDKSFVLRKVYKAQYSKSTFFKKLKSCFSRTVALLLLWIRTLRAPFFTASIAPVLLGTTVGWYETDNIRIVEFLLTLIGIVLLHAGTNMSNDYFDHLSGNDEANQNVTPFSGGSQIIQNKLIPAKQILFVALTWFVLGSAIGLYLNYKVNGDIVLYLGLIGVFSGFFYTAFPLKLGYRGIGEILIGLNFGVLVIVGSYYVQTEILSWRLVPISLPTSLLITAVVYINEFPDLEADAAVNKKTLVVKMGRAKSVYGYWIIMSLVYLTLVFNVLLGIMPVWCLIVFLTLPLTVKAVKILMKHFDNTAKLLPANANTIIVHFTFTILLCVGYLLDWIS